MNQWKTVPQETSTRKGQGIGLQTIECTRCGFQLTNGDKVMGDLMKEHEADCWKMEFLFGSEPIVAWRLFNWGAASETGQLMQLAGDAPSGENPFKWAVMKRLASVGVQAVWMEGQAKHAECNNTASHKAPVLNCACGLWAVRDRPAAELMTMQYNSPIMCEVKLWGRFVEHSRGWRAEYGYPVRAVVRAGKPDGYGEELAAEIGERYRIPAEVGEFTAAKQQNPQAHAQQVAQQMWGGTTAVTATSMGGLGSFITTNVTSNPTTFTTMLHGVPTSAGTSKHGFAPKKQKPPPAPSPPKWPTRMVHPSELWRAGTLVPQAGVYNWPRLPKPKR